MATITGVILLWLESGWYFVNWMSGMGIGAVWKRMIAATALLVSVVCVGSVASAPRRSAVMQELSKRSLIPVPELRALLEDCSRTQLSMNICAFRDFVEVDLRLGAAIESRRRSLSQECRLELDQEQQAWEAERDHRCEIETRDAEGGSMRPMLISACKVSATETRISVLKDWGRSRAQGRCE